MRHPNFEEIKCHAEGGKSVQDTLQQDDLFATLLMDHRAEVQDVLMKHCEVAAETIMQLTMTFQERVAGSPSVFFQERVAKHDEAADYQLGKLWHTSKAKAECAEPLQPGVLGMPIVQAEDENPVLDMTSTLRSAGALPENGCSPAIQPAMLKQSCNGLRPARVKASDDAFGLLHPSVCLGNEAVNAEPLDGFHAPGQIQLAPTPAMMNLDEQRDSVHPDVFTVQSTQLTKQWPSSSRIAKSMERSGTLGRVGVAEITDDVKARNISADMEERIKSLRQTGKHQGTKMGRGVFVDVEAMKLKLRRELSKPAYDVSDFYYETGFFRTVAVSQYFDIVTLCVIALNALWIAVDVDLNDAPMLVDANWEFQLVDNLFCVYFSLEWLVRFMSFRHKRDSFRDAWFVFDTFMCGLMVVETWIMTIVVLIFDFRRGKKMGDASLLKGFRLVRMIRMARIIRLLNALPELMVVIKGMAAATRAVSCTVLLMVLIVYVFSVIFRQLTDGTVLGAKYFRSVPYTMRFLVLQGTIPDLADVTLDIWADGILYAAIFLFFVLMVTITIMNMLVGVLVGVVSTVACVEKEQLTVNYVRENLLTVLRSVQKTTSSEASGKISKEDFGYLLQTSEALHAFNRMSVDVVGLVDLTDFIFKDGRVLEFSEFMELIMQLRGNNQATVKDIVDLRKFMVSELHFGHGREQVKHMENRTSCDVFVPFGGNCTYARTRSDRNKSSGSRSSDQGGRSAGFNAVDSGKSFLKRLRTASKTSSFKRRSS